MDTSLRTLQETLFNSREKKATAATNAGTTEPFWTSAFDASIAVLESKPIRVQKSRSAPEILCNHPRPPMPPARPALPVQLRCEGLGIELGAWCAGRGLQVAVVDPTGAASGRLLPGDVIRAVRDCSGGGAGGGRRGRYKNYNVSCTFSLVFRRSARTVAHHWSSINSLTENISFLPPPPRSRSTAFRCYT